MPDAQRRFRLSRAKGWRMPENGVNCGRPGVWGNPFVVGEHGTREECVQMHAALLTGAGRLSPGLYEEVQLAYRYLVIRHRLELAGRPLGCWCSLDGCCHVDTLLLVVNAPDAAATVQDA